MNELRSTREPVTSRSVKQKSEQVSLLFLLLWCLLPAAISIAYMIMGASGMLFPGRTIAEAAGRYRWGAIYFSALRFYHSAYWVIGVLTLAFAAMCAALCFRRLRSRESIRSYPWFYFLLGLLLWAIVSSAVSDNFLRALFGEFVLNDGLFSYFIYASVFLCASMLRKEADRRRVLIFYCAVVSYLALIMVCEEAGCDFLRACMPSKCAVVFNQFNHFGYLLCMGILAFFGLYLYDRKAGKGVKGIYLLGFAFLCYALLMNDTFGAYLATFFALPVAYIFHLHRGERLNFAKLLPLLIFILLSVLSTLALLPGANGMSVNFRQFGTDLWSVAIQSENAGRAGTGRYRLWTDTVKRIGQRPVFGFGPEGFYGENAIHNNDSPHNEYLQMAGFLGIPGLVLYLAALFTLAIHHWKHIRELDPLVVAVSGVTVVYLFSACFGNPVFNTAPYFWMFLGLTTAVGESAPSLLQVPELSAVNQQTRRRLAIGAVSVVLLGAVLGMQLHMAVKNEYLAEFSDLLAMEDAEMAARSMYARHVSKGENTFWFNADSFALIPAEQAKPAPYGRGTHTCGNSLYSFIIQEGILYSYDESADYTDKIIKVHALAWGDDLTVDMEWVPVE